MTCNHLLQVSRRYFRNAYKWFLNNFHKLYYQSNFSSLINTNQKQFPFNYIEFLYFCIHSILIIKFLSTSQPILSWFLIRNLTSLKPNEIPIRRPWAFQIWKFVHATFYASLFFSWPNVSRQDLYCFLIIVFLVAPGPQTWNWCFCHL